MHNCGVKLPSHNCLALRRGAKLLLCPGINKRLFVELCIARSLGAPTSQHAVTKLVS